MANVVFNPFTGNFDYVNSVTIGAFGSTPNANGLSIDSAQVLVLQPADGTNPGAISVGTQSIAGAKTFLLDVTMPNALITRSNNGVDAITNYIPSGAITPSNVTWKTGLTASTPYYELRMFDGSTDTVFMSCGLNGIIDFPAIVSAPAIRTTSISDIAGDAAIDVGGVNAKVETLGTADEVQLRVNANSTQTANIVEVYDDNGTLVVSIDPNGNLTANNFSGSSTGTNTGDVTLAAVGSSPNANAATLTGQVLNLEPADGTNPGVITAGSQTIGGSKTFSGLINADGGIDRSTAGTLTIGATNSTTINIGNSGATVNIQGTTIYENTPQLLVADPLITVNSGGGAGSGQNSGIQIEEAASITGYFETSADRNSWTMKAPNTAGIVTITPGVSGFTLNQGSHDPVTLTAVGSSPNANGASLSGQALTLQPADNTNPGVITAGTQTIGGAKTFSSTITGTTSGNTTYTPNNHGVVLSSATNAMTVLAPNASTVFPLVSGGASADPTWALLTVPGGGTGISSATAYAVLCGGTTSTGPFQSVASVGAAGEVLTSNGAGALPTFQAVTSTAPNSQIIVDGSNGYGSTNTRVPRFANTRLNNGGSDISYSDSSTLGATFTINTTGLYTIDYSAAANNAVQNVLFAITVNNSATTTNAQSLTYAQGKRSSGGAVSTGEGGFTSWTGRLVATDVVQPATNNSTMNNDATNMWSITRVG